MGIFSDKPVSFKMDRKSLVASKFKSSISKKLVQFLGTYTDDVLAEYIIVLVCNGKHQVQARDDLEAFLGERSGEFVSWLWNYLLKHACQSDSAIEFLDPQDGPFTSPSCGSADKCLRSNRVQDIHNCNAESPLTKNGKHDHPSSHASSPVPSNNMEFSERLKYSKGTGPLKGGNTTMGKLEKQRSTITRSSGSTEKSFDDYLPHESFGRVASSLISTARDQKFKCMDRSKNIVSHEGNGLPSELLNLPKREMGFRNMQPCIGEDPYARNVLGSNAATRISPRPVGEISCQTKNSRGSVWDRLGKPFKKTSFISGKSVESHVDILKKDVLMDDQHTLVVPDYNDNLYGNIRNEVYVINKNGGSNTGEWRKPESGLSTIHNSDGVTDIQRKRPFNEISSGPSSHSVVCGSNLDCQYTGSSHDSKRSNSTSEAAAPALVSEVEHMKQKLCQIEMEMSKLRSKQLKLRKDGQQHSLSNSGMIKHSDEDVESRTVFVTNVHFAATKEALSSHFAKCGLVLNVIILTEKLTARPKGSAYITFADKEAADRAVILSGTSFFSRTLKVRRKAQEATMVSTPPQPTRKLLQAQFPHIKRNPVCDRPCYPSNHLQWQREPDTCASESSPSITEGKRQRISSTSLQ